MQSTFLLKSIIFFVLIINVTLCRCSITEAWCNARCYWSQYGFDYGYFDNGQCKCAPPTVYIFNGVGRDLSGEYIETSLNNNNLIENPITRYNQNRYERIQSNPSTAATGDLNNSNAKMWEEIVKKITTTYTFIEETDLENLRTRISDDASTMRYLIAYLRKPLEFALEETKKVRPYAAAECDELLTLLLRHKYDEEKSKNLETPKQNKGPTVQGKSIAPNAVVPKRLKPEKRPDDDEEDVSKKHKKSIGGDGRKENDLSKTKSRPAATTASRDKKSQKVFVEVTEEEFIDDDDDDGGGGDGGGGDHSVKKVKQSSAKNKAAVKEHEVNGSGSGSGSWTYEEI